MVLEEASSPPSDIDPFADDSNGSSDNPMAVRGNLLPINRPPDQVWVDLNNVPKLPFVKFQHVANLLQEQCAMLSKTIERPLHPQEADAYVYYNAKAGSLLIYGICASAGLATVQAFRRRKQVRFPLWTPSEKVLASYRRGLAGRAMWEVARYGTYMATGGTLGWLFFSSYAITTTQVGFHTDPRLKEVLETLKAKREARQGQLPNREVDTTAGPRPGETYEMARQRKSAQDAWKRSQQARQAQQAAREVDDMSPTGGQFERETESAGQSDFGLMSDSQVLERENHAQTQSNHTPSSSQAHQPRSTETTTSTASSPDSASKQSGSAWDRLRQQAASNKASDSTSRRSASTSSQSSSADSFAVIESDHDRLDAKSEAQKEFDARVESERRGRDFDDPDSKRKWE